MTNDELKAKIRDCRCETCRALVSLLDKDGAGANLRIGTKIGGRFCELAVVAAAGENGLTELEVVEQRRSYANHLGIVLSGNTQDADWPIHIHHALSNSNHNLPHVQQPIHLGTARASFRDGRYFLTRSSTLANESALVTVSPGPGSALADEAPMPEGDAEGYYSWLEAEVSRSRKNSQARKARLETAPKKPESIAATTTVFKRNPDVIAEVLERANGFCENGKCRREAPFRRARDNSPYLEVHHRIPLAEGGDDAVENALALCLNCHREAHFG